MIDLSRIRTVEAKVVYLKMSERPPNVLFMRPEATFVELEKPISRDDYLHLYKSVGLRYNWLDRLVMNGEELALLINAENVHVFVMKIDDAHAGFVEFVREEDHVELLYFGLFPEFIGRGLGKFFLDWCIHKAWSYHPRWIQLNTCDLDHVNALPNYRSLGFVPYKTTVEVRRTLD